MSGTITKPKVIKAKRELQQKVGMGPLDPNKVAASQSVIENNQVDFAPHALEILERLHTALALANDGAALQGDLKQALTRPVMELKAHSAIFHYTLVGNLANIMLHFLESIQTLDEDAVHIVRAHHDTLRLIIIKKMSGNGGAVGKQLEGELQNACNRYYSKKSA